MNSRSLFSVAALSLAMAIPQVGYGQPSVNGPVSRESRAKLEKEWEAKGKPHIPWAAKSSDLPQSPIPAFPGAWGGGMYSFGGRGGKVYVVTNLNDSGPGSFREAAESVGPRIVLFNVAGQIDSKSQVVIRSPYITISGATAPGDGVCITGAGLSIDTHDVVIRYMRFRGASNGLSLIHI